MQPPKIINILGVRGVPAAYGGFETFAAQLSQYLTARGWTVSVYCQIEPDAEGRRGPDREDDWNGVRRIHLGSGRRGAVGSLVFDARCIWRVRRRPGIDLVLGYNTAIFSLLQRMHGRVVLMNMDGVEWKRAKWKRSVKAWFYLNEFLGSHIASVPIADHPEIARHLRRHGCRRAVTIPYGANLVDAAPIEPLAHFGLTPDNYLVSIARIEPENSILEIVRAFSAKARGASLIVLGHLHDENAYHRHVRLAASSEVVLPGAIYDPELVAALRFHARAYVHGHQVGGTNPSLVEALGAGNAILAHDNSFNRWVCGPQQFYFDDERTLRDRIDDVLADASSLAPARQASRQRFSEQFQLEHVLAAYEALLLASLG